MECYDRIIRSHAILNSHKFGISDNLCKVYNIVHDIMQFRAQINNTISKKCYSNTKTRTYHGVGQEAGNRDTKWKFKSITIIEIVEEVS